MANHRKQTNRSFISCYPRWGIVPSISLYNSPKNKSLSKQFRSARGAECRACKACCISPLVVTGKFQNDLELSAQTYTISTIILYSNTLCMSYSVISCSLHNSNYPRSKDPHRLEGSNYVDLLAG